MSAQQIHARPSDAEARGNVLADLRSAYAGLRAAMIADRATSVVVRAAVGILGAVAAVILVAGVATQSAFAMIAGGLGVAAMAGVLLVLAPASAKTAGRQPPGRGFRRTESTEKGRHLTCRPFVVPAAGLPTLDAVTYPARPSA